MAVAEDQVPLPPNVVRYEGQSPNVGSLQAVIANLQRQILSVSASSGGTALPFIYAASAGAPGGTANDTASLVNLLAALKLAYPTGGWTLVLAPVMYSLNADAINITAQHNCTIEGFGSDHGSPATARFTTLSFITGGAIGFNWGNGVGNCLRNLCIDGGTQVFSQAVMKLGDNTGGTTQSFHMDNVQVSNYGRSNPYTPFGQGRALILQAVQDSWFNDCVFIRHDVSNIAPSAGAVYLTNSNDPNPGGTNCDQLRFNACQFEEIVGSSFYVSDSCNADMIWIGGGTKFERGNTFATSAYVVYLGDIFRGWVRDCVFTNYSSSFYTMIQLGGVAGLGGGSRCAAVEVTNNLLTSCTAPIVTNAVAQCVIVQDNIGVNSTSSVVLNNSGVAGSILENPFSISNTTPTGWEEGTRRFEREAVGFMPITRFAANQGTKLLHDVANGLPLYQNVMHATQAASAILVDLQRSTLSKIKDQQSNIIYDFAVRRTADDITPGASHNARFEMNTAGGSTRQIPYLDPLPGSIGIASISGSGVTVTVNTIQPHGFAPAQVVVIAGTVNYNGTITIGATPTSTQFTYASAIVPAETVGGVRPVNVATISGDGTTVTLVASAGTLAAAGVVGGDRVVVTGTTNYNTPAGSPGQILTLVGDTITYAGSNTGSAEVTGNWQKCQWQNVQWTMAPASTAGLGESGTDRLRLQYSADGTATQIIDIAKVGITPYRVIPSFFAETVVNAGGGQTLATSALSSARVIRLGLSADSTDTLPAIADMLQVIKSIAYDGIQTAWEYCNLTPFTVTLHNADVSGALQIRNVYASISPLTDDIIPPFTCAQYRLAWLRVSVNDPVARLQRVGQYRTTDLSRYIATSLAADADSTLSAASVLGTHLFRTGLSTNRHDTMATAANIVAAVPIDSRYSSMAWIWRYLNQSAYYITLTNNTGVTLATAIIAPGMAQDFLVTITSIGVGSEAVTFALAGDYDHSSALPTAAFTAHAGGGQASAVILTGRINRVGTVASAGDSVKMPAGIWSATMSIKVFNEGANSMDLFPNSGGTINGGAANAAIAVASNTGITIQLVAASTWKTG